MNAKEPALIMPGKYIIAVSGGVDSVVLLDMLAKKPDLKLVVAHFDHGIRTDSAEDAEFVRELAEKYELPFEVGRGNLGEKASEAVARRARYQFLADVQKKHGADGIITAHHQDDMVETAAINLLRGTGRKGLSALKSRPHLPRPLLHLTKQDILDYAKVHQLKWREDSTNQDKSYLRNKLRHDILPAADDEWRRRMLKHIARAEELNQQVDREIEAIVKYKLNRGMAISRKWFVMLPHTIACEVVAALLRHLEVADIDSPLIERLVVSIKTARPGKQADIDGRYYLLLTKRSARIMNRKSGKTARV